MIQDHNLKITEEEYRDLDLPSYSMLSSISKNGIDVVEGTINGVFELKFGSLVDDMCFNTDILSKKYYAGTAPKNPTTNVKKVIDYILNTINNSDNGEEITKTSVLGTKRSKKITKDLKNYTAEARAGANHHNVYGGYSNKKLMETLIEKGQEYFKDKMESKGRIFIKPEMWNKAYATATTLVTHPFSRKYFDHEVEGIEIIYQYKFIANVNGRDVKGMLDCVYVDHNNKKIIPVDLKTGEFPVIKFKDVFLGYNYYIQGALYKEGLKSIVDNDPDLNGYTVEDFEFLYISKQNEYKPLVWVMGDDIHQAALKGFKDVYNYKHKGVYDLLEDYYGCKEGRNCQYVKEVYDNDGRMMLNDVISYDEKMENNNIT